MDTRRMLTRLRVMSADEISFRVRGKAREQIDRIRARIHPDGVHLLEIPREYLTRDYVSAEPARKFFTAISYPNVRGFVHDTFPEWVSKARSDADEICEG